MATALSFEIMMDVLLIVVIGSMGTMYGAIVGAARLALAVGAAVARPLVAVAGCAVCPLRLLLPLRCGGETARPKCAVLTAPCQRQDISTCV